MSRNDLSFYLTSKNPQFYESKSPKSDSEVNESFKEFINFLNIIYLYYESKY